MQLDFNMNMLHLREMKIVFVSRHFHPHLGGVEKHIEKITDLLIKQGHRIDVICEKVPHTQSYSKKGSIDIYRVDYQKKKLLGLVQIWLWFIKNRKLFKDADVVHIHDVVIWYLPLIFILRKVSIFATFHGWEGIYPIPKKLIYLRKLSAYLVGGNICVGKYIEKYYGISASKVIYGATDIIEHITLSKQNSKRILYLGRLDPDTGLKTYLLAFQLLKQKHPEIKFEFLGDGVMKKDCESLGVVHGFKDDILPYVEDCRFVCTSGYLSMLEALALKRLIFSVSENQIKFDILRMSPFEQLTIHSTDSYSLARKIEFYLNDPIYERKVVAKGYEWAKSQTWDKIVEVYLNLWNLK
jgi:glycosyltransferase involved in cell wall biosynthesis